MSTKIELGSKGEKIALNYLLSKGFTILETNWRFKNEEIDIVAKNNNELIIVEVKTRSAAIYEEPRESISDKKIRFLVNATEAYINEHDIDYETRFDVISIKWFGENKYIIDHIINAFSPPVN